MAVMVPEVTVETLIHPGMLLPCAKKVTLPETLTLTVIVLEVLYVAAEIESMDPENAE